MPIRIYTSEKVMPYVYWGTHKITGQFYIGYSANKKQKLPSHLDLGTRYFTSSEKVEELGFENFNWIIIAEFFNREYAHSFEQELIEIHIKNPLNLNQYVNKKFSNINGKTNKGKTKYTDQYLMDLSIRMTGQTKETCEQFAKMAHTMSLQNVDNCERIQKRAITIKGRNKKNCEYIAKSAEKQRKFPVDQYSKLVELKELNLDRKIIKQYFANIGIEISITHISTLYYQIVRGTLK